MIGSRLDHYEILDKLGTGGMGEVFVAEDTKLSRKVAIKILPEDLAADPERRERFEREARTIAALNHPNIVTIYSVEEADGLHFITMELVEGKSLSELLPAEGLPLDEFFKLAVPMVEALDAAHKKGIAHRDIKPGNIMVTDDGRVKVLDFGLAKLTREQPDVNEAEAATMIAPSDLTEQGQILGTVNYMSPEQAEGRAVDPRSDIFSLGVVLYEMATGEAPFKGDTKVSVITSIMRDTPPPVSDVRAELPHHLGRVVNRALAKDPDRRYQSTTDLRNELDGLKEEIATSELRQSAVRLSDVRDGGVGPGDGDQGGMPERAVRPSDGRQNGIRERPSGGGQSGVREGAVQPSGEVQVGVGQVDTPQPDTKVKASPAGTVLKYAGLAAGALAVLGLAYIAFAPPGDPPPEPETPSASALAVADAKPSLAVLYFENLSDDENLDWLRTGLTEMLVTDLAQSPSIRVLGTDRLHQILEDIGAADDEMTSASVVDAVAEQGSVDHVLLGSFARAGNQVRISARLQSAVSGEILASETVEGEGEEAIFPLVDDLTRRIKAQFDMAEEMVAADVDADLTDVTTDSVDAYRSYAEGIVLHEQLREDEAIPLLERAVEIDPEFAMAHAKLAVAFSNIGEFDAAREHSETAMQHLDRVTDRERYYIEGRHYSLEQGGIEQAIAAYQKAVELYPDHTSARNNLAQSLVNLERFDEAIGHLEELRRAGMPFPGTYATLANAYGATGQLDEALEALEEYSQRNPENAAGFENLAGFLAWHGRLEPASRMLDRAERLGRPPADIGHLRWQIAMLAGDAELADRALEVMRDSEEIRARANAAFDAAVMALFEGDADAAFEYLDDLAEIAATRQQALNFQAGLLLDLGDFDGALELADRMVSEGDDPQELLNGFGTRALALVARDGIEAAAPTFDDLWAQVDALNLPARIASREEERFRGTLAFYAGDWEQAIERISGALEQSPPNPPMGNSQRPRMHYLMAVSHYELGELDAAEGNLRRALEFTGRLAAPLATVRAHWYLGQIYERRDDTRRAREQYERLVDYWGASDIDEERVAHAEAYLGR